jgi:hypothetical protein
VLGLVWAAPALAQDAADGAVGPGACQRLALVDGGTGEPVRGAEDLVIDRATGEVYLSAYDRWALADALDADAARLPQGGIYTVPLMTLRRQPERLPLRRLAGKDGRDLHPHGLTFHRGGDGAELIAINHAYRRSGGDWARRTRLEVYTVTADGLSHRRSARHPKLCQTNSLTALSPEDLLVTRTHGACGRSGTWLENVLGLDRAQVLLATLAGSPEIAVETLADDIGYANGIALSPDGATLAVAATRDAELRLYDVARLLTGVGEALLRRIEVPGGPDNLSWSPDGRLIAAVHPSLFAVALAKYRWFGRRRAGSQVIAVTPETGDVEVLLHDPDGRLLNTATAAAVVDDMLIVSGVLDDALLVCRDPD